MTERQSIEKKILAAASSIALATILVKLVSLLKDMVVASFFGTGPEMDAFVIALAIPSYLINVLSISLVAAFLPLLVEVRAKEGAQSARLFAANAAILNALITLSVTLLLILFAPRLLGLLGPQFGKGAWAPLVTRLFFTMLPLVVVSGTTNLFAAVLNSKRSFFPAAALPMLIPLATIGGACAWSKSMGVAALGLGVLIGYLLELIGVAAVLLSKADTAAGRMRVHPEIKTLIRQYVPLALGAALTSSSPIVDQVMASWLGAGSSSTLSYGSKLVGLAVNLATTSLGVAALPYISSMVSSGDRFNLRRILNLYCRWILLASIPVVALFVAASRLIVEIFFQRGAFTPEDTLLVAQVQAVYAFQLPFYTLIVLFLRYISALRLNHFMLIGTLVSVLLNVVLNYMLMQYLGVVGIALSTVCVQALSSGFLALVIYVKIPADSPPRV